MKRFHISKCAVVLHITLRKNIIIYISVLKKENIRLTTISVKRQTLCYNESLVLHSKADNDYAVVTINVPSLCFIVSWVLGLTFVMTITKQQRGIVRSIFLKNWAECLNTYFSLQCPFLLLNFVCDRDKKDRLLWLQNFRSHVAVNLLWQSNSCCFFTCMCI